MNQPSCVKNVMRLNNNPCQFVQNHGITKEIKYDFASSINFRKFAREFLGFQYFSQDIANNAGAQLHTRLK